MNRAGLFFALQTFGITALIVGWITVASFLLLVGGLVSAVGGVMIAALFVGIFLMTVYLASQDGQ